MSGDRLRMPALADAARRLALDPKLSAANRRTLDGWVLFLEALDVAGYEIVRKDDRRPVEPASALAAVIPFPRRDQEAST